MNKELKHKIHDLITFEARSCSMDPTLVTPEYVGRKGAAGGD